MHHLRIDLHKSFIYWTLLDDDRQVLFQDKVKTTEEDTVQALKSLPVAAPRLQQTLLEMRFQNAGVYRLDDEEREALDRSEGDVRAGRFASEDEMEAAFARYRA